MKKFKIFFEIDQPNRFTIEIEPDELIIPKTKFIKAVRLDGVRNVVYINVDSVIYFTEYDEKENDTNVAQ